VLAAATTTSISAPTFVYNEPGTVTVTVAAGAGVPTPSGTVSLALDDGVPQTATLDSNGQATFSVVGPDVTSNPHTLTATYAAQGNYAASASFITVNANQSATSVAISAPAVTYNANGSVTVTVSSVDGTPSGTVSLIVDGDSAHPLAGTLDGSGNALFTLASPAAGDHTLEAAYAAQGNFAGSAADASLHVDQAATTVGVSAPTVTYNTNGTVTVTVSSASGTPGGNVSLSVDGGATITQTLDGNSQSVFTLASPAAGDHSLHVVYAAQGNFAGSSADANLHVNQANGNITVNPFSGTYDGLAHGLTGSASGVAGEDLTSLLHLGSAYTNAGHYVVTWTFDGNTNYNSATGTSTIDIGKANASISVTPYSLTYDSTAHTATGTATGVLSEDLSGDLTVSGTTHTAAGTYSGDAWSFHDPNGNYNDASGTVNDAIGLRDLYVTANANSKTYGQAVSDTGSIGGVQGSDGITVSFSSAGDSATAAVGSGSYVITATLSDPNSTLSNYAVHETDATLTVNKANASINVTPYSATYDSNAHTATGTATGVFSENLSTDLTLSGTTHTAAGTYSGDAWSFHDPNANYNDAGGTVNDAIGLRDLYVTANANSKTYGQAASETGSISGVQGSDGVTASFSSAGDAAAAAVGSGSYTITATLSDPNSVLSNYTVHETDATLTVNKANASIRVTPYSITYDSTAHTATGTATGVFSENLSSDLTLSGTTHALDGTYNGDAWSFHDPNGNYNDASGTVNDIIGEANATVMVSGYTGGTYDGSPHTQTVTVTGVGGDGVLFTTSLTGTNAGNYSLPWSFSNSNYNASGESGTLAFSIGQASSPILVTSDVMLSASNPAPLTGGTVPAFTGTANGSTFTSSTTFNTPQGDTLKVTLSCSVTSGSAVGTYPIIATVTGSNVGNYQAPAVGSLYVVTVGKAAGTGPAYVNFWDSHGNAASISLSDLANLDALNLVNATGSAFDPTTALQLQSWLQSNSGTNAAYLLSVQLATMDLNLLSGYVQGTDIVYAPGLLQFVGTAYSTTGLDGGGFITVANLMALGNNALAAHPTALAGDPWRLYLGDLAQALGGANGDATFVQQSV
jgi:hypothetical protein